MANYIGRVTGTQAPAAPAQTQTRTVTNGINNFIDQIRRRMFTHNRVDAAPQTRTQIQPGTPIQQQPAQPNQAKEDSITKAQKLINTVKDELRTLQQTLPTTVAPVALQQRDPSDFAAQCINDCNGIMQTLDLPKLDSQLVALKKDADELNLTLQNEDHVAAIERVLKPAIALGEYLQPITEKLNELTTFANSEKKLVSSKTMDPAMKASAVWALKNLHTALKTYQEAIYYTTLEAHQKIYDHVENTDLPDAEDSVRSAMFQLQAKSSVEAHALKAWRSTNNRAEVEKRIKYDVAKPNDATAKTLPARIARQIRNENKLMHTQTIAMHQFNPDGAAKLAGIDEYMATFGDSFDVLQGAVEDFNKIQQMANPEKYKNFSINEIKFEVESAASKLSKVNEALEMQYSSDVKQVDNFLEAIDVPLNDLIERRQELRNLENNPDASFMDDAIDTYQNIKNMLTSRLEASKHIQQKVAEIDRELQGMKSFMDDSINKLQAKLADLETSLDTLQNVEPRDVNNQEIDAISIAIGELQNSINAPIGRTIDSLETAQVIHNTMRANPLSFYTNIV
ncbi:MAG: hypothetical protein HWE26_17630 [Alteromonadaceae bacterium]|nr:hypothetical protein [Alteromonadaceae bacterium]